MLNNYFNDIKRIVANHKDYCSYKVRLVEVIMTSSDCVFVIVKIGRKVFRIQNNFSTSDDSYAERVAYEIYKDLKENDYVEWLL